MINLKSLKYRLAIVEYTTLKGFGISCSIEQAFDTMDSARRALSQTEEAMKQISTAHIEYRGSNTSFVLIDNNTNLIMTRVMIHPYGISDDGKDFVYRGHRISTMHDNELERDILVVHNLDGKEYIERTTIEAALDTIDWICCTGENANIARMALEEAIKEKKENNDEVPEV